MDDRHRNVSEGGVPPSDGPKAPGRRRRFRLAAITSLAVVLVLALVAAGAFAWVSFTFSKANNQPGVEEARTALQETVPSTEPLPATDTTSTMQPANGTSTATTLGSAGTSTATTTPFVQPETPGAMNILVLGADRRPSAKEKYGRADTMMVVHIDPKDGFLSVLSPPRDLSTSAPAGCAS
jgi:anionic cell wall polymer biosynthesis LytR-Cps2A-Psr (LCP) family protein